jgi:flagellar hook-associated protein 3 FlgL
MRTMISPSSEAFLANISRVQRSVEEAGRQASSGRRVNVASDAPDQIDAILQLRSSLVRNSQIQANLGLAKTNADAADSSLSAAVKMLDRALVLGTQGSSFTLNAAGRQSIAIEVQGLQDQMLVISRTTVQGRFIFSGDQDSGPAYEQDLTSPNGVTQLLNVSSTRRMEDPAGGSFAVNKGAQEIFDARNADGTLASDNVFAALNSLRLALLNNDTSQIAAATSSIKLASDHLNSSQGFYGAVQNRIQDAANYGASYDVQLKTELSGKVDADIAEAAMAMTQGNNQLQAAFQMQAKMPRTSLFDYLG